MMYNEFDIPALEVERLLNDAVSQNPEQGKKNLHIRNIILSSIIDTFAVCFKVHVSQRDIPIIIVYMGSL